VTIAEKSEIVNKNPKIDSKILPVESLWEVPLVPPEFVVHESRRIGINVRATERPALKVNQNLSFHPLMYTNIIGNSTIG
jgi:hypothetical protein